MESCDFGHDPVASCHLRNQDAEPVKTVWLPCFQEVPTSLSTHLELPSLKLLSQTLAELQAEVQPESQANFQADFQVDYQAELPLSGQVPGQVLGQIPGQVPG